MDPPARVRTKKQYAIFSEPNLNTIKNLLRLYLQARDFSGKGEIHIINICLRPFASEFSHLQYHDSATS